MERAAELFAARGIAATSVDEVLAAAGAGKGQFYHYFRSRDELAAAAVGHRCAQVVAGLTQALGGVSSLAGLEQAPPGSTPGNGCWPPRRRARASSTTTSAAGTSWRQRRSGTAARR